MENTHGNLTYTLFLLKIKVHLNYKPMATMAILFILFEAKKHILFVLWAQRTTSKVQAQVKDSQDKTQPEKFSPHDKTQQ